MDKAQIKKEETKMDFKKVAEENFSKWNEALQTGDPEKVADLYEYADYAPGECLIFLPTMSDKVISDRQGVTDYFTHFLTKKPSGSIINEGMQFFGENAYSHGGRYDFKVTIEEESEIVEARHTYIWRKNNNGEWKIIQHHSSVKPPA